MTKRHIQIVLIGVVLLFVSVGTTYAWWTASAQVKQTVKMGNLSIEATMEELDDSTGYEPGLDIQQNGTLTNTGSIEAIARVDGEGFIQFAGSDESVKLNKKTYVSTIKPLDGEGYWFKDPNGQAYVLLSPGETANFELLTEFKGEYMNNNYAGANLDISSNLKATQVLGGAMESELGIDYESLENYDSTSSRSRTQSPGMTVLHELVSRGQ